MPGGDWTPRDLLAHVLAWQAEALRRLCDPEALLLGRADIDAWNAAAHEQLRSLTWDDVLAALEHNHLALRALLWEEPPDWFGRYTHRHYTEHTRVLLRWLETGARDAAGAAAGRSVSP